MSEQEHPAIAAVRWIRYCEDNPGREEFMARRSYAEAEIRALIEEVARLTPTPEEREAIARYPERQLFPQDDERVLRAFFKRVTVERTEPK